MWRLHAEGKLEGPQQLMMQTSRPVEELYDCESDPFELNNLAADPNYLPTLERMRTAMADWKNRCGDLGELSEEQLVARMWPGGERPQTGMPIFVPIDQKEYGIESASEGGKFKRAIVRYAA
jgi:hypothetical protein